MESFTQQESKVIQRAKNSSYLSIVILTLFGGLLLGASLVVSTTQPPQPELQERLAPSDLSTASVQRTKITVAVASNFTTALQRIIGELGGDFEVVMVSGATGKLASQIQNGAPFDLFLAADEKHVELLETQGKLLRESHFVYTTGRVAAWAPSIKGGPVEIERRLKSGQVRYVAIANPVTAPYGVAAQEILKTLQIWNSLESQKQVLRGESVAQTFHFARSGAAEIAFVSVAQLLNEPSSHYWEVPQNIYNPIRQAGAIVATSAFQREAYALIDLLRSPRGQMILGESGYKSVE